MLLTLDDFSSSISRLCVSPGGTRLALINEEGPGEVLVIEVPSGERVARYSGLHEGPRAAFCSESELIIVHGRDCRLCDLTAGPHRVLPLPDDLHDRAWLYCCRPSPDGTAVALGGGWTEGLLILDLARGGVPRRARVPCATWVEAITYSPDGRFVSAVHIPADDDREVRLISVLDARSGALIRQLKLPWQQFYVYPTAFDPRGQLLAVGWKASVLLFELDPPESPLDPEVLFGGDFRGYPMGWGRPTACYPLGAGREVKDLWFSPEGIVLKVLCEDGEAILLGRDEGQVLQQTPPPTDRRKGMFGADISSSGRAAVRVDAKTVLTWEVPGWGEA